MTGDVDRLFTMLPICSTCWECDGLQLLTHSLNQDISGICTRVASLKSGLCKSTLHHTWHAVQDISHVHRKCGLYRDLCCRDAPQVDCSE